MRRREFIMLIGGAAALPLGVRAQQPGKLPTIGFLGGATASTWRLWVDAFVLRLRELGWIEGRSVAIEYRWAEGSDERATEIASEFIRLKVDVIVTSGGVLLGAKRVTTAIPIVFAIANDPVGSGFVANLRDRAATSPGFRCNRRILLLSDSNSCARFFLVSVG
jgi:putative tryptophan/tyrosine transport system substrate-binding protein